LHYETVSSNLENQPTLIASKGQFQQPIAKFFFKIKSSNLKMVDDTGRYWFLVYFCDVIFVIGSASELSGF